jgi:peptidoglycan/xylan/chitin deacetylase (PgdA/CDA1 family)
VGLIAAFPAALLAFSFLVRPPEPRDPPSVTVLTYHNFNAHKKTPFTIDSQKFQEQMRFLKVQKYPVIPLDDLVNHLLKGTPVPDHAVVITIDDGYKTAKTVAWPILKRFNFPFTLYVYPQFFGKPSALTWEDLKVLSKAGVDIQSHSLTHPLLTHPDKAMNRKEYIDWIDNELLESRQQLEHYLGKPVRDLAYPFGGYDETIVERVEKAGYRSATTCDDGNVTRFVDPLHINRRLVYRGVKFKEFTQYFPDRSLQIGELYPRDGERAKHPVGEIRARILNFDQILPGSASILIDKVSRKHLPIDIDPEGHIRFPLPKEHKKGYYFISLYARDKRQPALQREASWIFIISKNVSK